MNKNYPQQLATSPSREIFTRSGNETSGPPALNLSTLIINRKEKTNSGFYCSECWAKLWYLSGYISCNRYNCNCN